MTKSDDDTVKLQSGRFAAGNDDDDGRAISLRAQYVF